MTEAERVMANLVPTIQGDADDFLSERRNIKRVSGLHGVMAFEVISFIDGTADGA